MLNRAALARIDGLLFDLDGVVYRGLLPLPGADRLTMTLRNLGIAHGFVTNNATLTPRQFQSKLAKMGIAVHAQNIVTSPVATAAYLRTVAHPGAPMYVVGERGLRLALQRAGFNVGGPKPEYVVVGLHRHLRYVHLAEACLAIHAGATLVATNADPAIPVEQGWWPGAGAILAAITTATGATPTIIGKPQPALVQIALQHIGVAPERAAMVGDQVETDVRAGQAAGLATILVQSDGSRPTPDPQPSLVVRDLAELLDVLVAARG